MPLAQHNIYYRNLALYDQLGDGPGTAKLIAELTDTYGPAEVGALLDLGCGTGRDLYHLAERFPGSVCVGIDLQPQMVGFARQQYPKLDIRQGDLRDVRLGNPVDVLTCLGNSLAYVRDNAEVRQAFTTFRVHAHAGTLLVLYLPVGITPVTEPTTQRSGSFDAKVTISYEWDLRSQVETMIRLWRFDDGHTERDVIRRRVIFPRELELWLDMSGFELLEIFDDPQRRNAPLVGPGAYVVARRTYERFRSALLLRRRPI